MPKLTIGMAHYDDFDGVYFSIQALRIYHQHLMRDVEIIVVDNSPNSPASPHIRALVEGNGRVGQAGSKYIPYGDSVGTSASRNRIFEEASGDFVLAMDCHVLLVPGALDTLLGFYAAHPDTSDLLTGPLLQDDLVNLSTHYDDVWRAEMWGIWGQAWGCKCGKGVNFSMTEADGKTTPRLLSEGNVPITMCGVCGQSIPSISWAGHEKEMESLGYKRLGFNPNDMPFEIPGQGLGLFSCRRDAWLGFNKDARGFGGEEMYIHTKYRQAGHKALCIPALKWGHRFSRPAGVPYPLTRWNKIRNYVLEFNELDLGLAPVHGHFVEELSYLNQSDWDALVADPVGLLEQPGSKAGGCGSCGSDAIQPSESLDEVFENLVQIKRDLNEHMPKLRELAASVGHVTEITARRESTIALMAGQPDVLMSHSTEKDNLVDHMIGAMDGKFVAASGSLNVRQIEETDFLFIDTVHTYARLVDELDRFAPKVSRFIALHDTHVHGEKGEDGGKGLTYAMTDFMRAFPEWSVIYHTNDQYGLTVLGKLEKDKPELPSKWTMATNLTKAMIGYAQQPGFVSKHEKDERLKICSMCPHRKDSRCTVCGCFVDEKSNLKSSDCPLAMWPAMETKPNE